MGNNGRGTKAVALANAFVAIADDPWAIVYNSAGLTQLQDIQCAAFVVPEQFGLSELRTVALAVAVPVHFGTLGLKAERFGFDLYNESEFGLALARKIDGKISAGITADIHHIAISRYGSVTRLTLEAGMLANILARAALGFSVSNIAGATIGKNNERLPQVLCLGARWCPSNSLLLTLEAEKDVRYPASIKAGIEQKVVSALYLRGGIANNPDKYSIGIALQYLPITFSYAGYSHADLGWTHQIELSCVLDG